VSKGDRILWLLIILLSAMLTSFISGWLHWLAHKEVPSAARAAGVTFAATFTLMVLAYVFIETGQ
jgi:hypothetical protein